MHAFILGILSHHCREIWGMGVDIDDGDGTTNDPVSAEVRFRVHTWFSALAN
jgi:hypothetical protein